MVSVGCFCWVQLQGGHRRDVWSLGGASPLAQLGKLGLAWGWTAASSWGLEGNTLKSSLCEYKFKTRHHRHNLCCAGTVLANPGTASASLSLL